MKKLIDKALALNMDDAQIVSIDQLEVDPSLANYCCDCEAYGLSAHCPPHGLSSSEFSDGLADYNNVLVIKRDVPVAVLQSDDQLPIARQIHLTVAQLEKQAQLLGFNAAAYAGGSCKRLFCSSSQQCQLLQQGGICRFPQWARPSVSGVGINVFALCETLGWPIAKVTKHSPADDGDMGLLVGLVLLGQKK
jgi:predicted metal-binding protein